MITFLRDLIYRDFWLKLFSLALALLTWVTVNVTQGFSFTPVRLAPSETRAFTRLPILVITSADDVRGLRVSPTTVDLVVQGEPRVIKRLQDSDIRVFVDLTGIQATHALRKRVEISMPPGVAHIKVQPEEVQVVFPPSS